PYINLGLIKVDEKNYPEALTLFERGYLLKRKTGIETKTIRAKIIHDAEQLEFLLSKGLLPEKYKKLIEAYRKMISENNDSSLIVLKNSEVTEFYGKNIYIEKAQRLRKALNDSINISEIQEHFKR